MQVSINDVHKFHTMDTEDTFIDGTNTVVFDFDNTLTKKTVTSSTDSNVFGSIGRKEMLRNMIEEIRNKGYNVIVLTLNPFMRSSQIKKLLLSELEMDIDVYDTTQERKIDMFKSFPLLFVDDAEENLKPFRDVIKRGVMMCVHESPDDGLEQSDVDEIVSMLPDRRSTVSPTGSPARGSALSPARRSAPSPAKESALSPARGSALSSARRLAPKLKKKKRRSRTHTISRPNSSIFDDDDDVELFPLRL